MRPAVRTTTLALLVVLASSSAPTALARSSPEGSAALSHPREDPYYPGKGDPRTDTLHYGLQLRWAPRSRTLSGTATIRLRVTRDVRRLKLDLGDPLRVEAAILDRSSVPAQHRGKNLVIETGALAKNSRHTLRISYSGTPKAVKAPVSRSDISTVGWHTTKSGSVWAMSEPFGAFTWYPVNDHPSDKAYYDVTISTPKKDVGIFNGRLASRRVVDGRTVTRWHLGSPAASYLTTIAIGDYRHYRDTGPHGLPISYWVEPRDRDLLPVLRKTPRMMRWLEGRLGRYPFRRVGAVVVPGQSALETQTLVTMGRGLGSIRSQLLTDLHHEYAHQWYGDSVTPDNWKDLWLNEGFATYLQVRYAAHRGELTMRHWRRGWRSLDQQLRRAYGPPGEYFRDEFASVNVYLCPAFMLDRLHAKLGPQLFWKVMRRWPQTHRFADVRRSEWVDWLNRVTGRHLRPFVHAWLTSKRTPGT